MAKKRSYEVPTPPTDHIEIVTSRDGRPLDSIPKSKRHAARKAVEEFLNENPWDHAVIDPVTLQQQAHIVANSRRRGQPTRSNQTRRAIRHSQED